MYDEPSECGRDHVACAFDRVINTKGLTAALYEMLCNERNGDRRKRSCTEPLDEPHQHQQLWVYNEKQERAENKHGQADKQRCFHPSPVGDETSKRFSEQLG